MKKLILALLIAVCALSFGFAQAVKLGYVNTDRILVESNEASEIARLFNLDKQNWMTQVRQLDEQIKLMERDFEIDKLTKNEAAKREAQARIETKKAEAGRMLEEYFGEGGKADKRYGELIDPLTLKIHTIIKKIADDEKYTMVFDVSYGVILYAAPQTDITEQVLQVLNKDTIAPAADKTNQQNQTQPNTTKPKDPFDFGAPGKP
ncbi:MAG: OmpH family outer membrane protein [Candidatus Cloacimonadaceae bacterium]|nr:OmpH family outer membrane protein [Candidatus Cloacimonadaceae bacterium]MDP3113944.1 OmpH family outer membrane protein [Candidatus Cloacimonadaceae bacterium]